MEDTLESVRGRRGRIREAVVAAICLCGTAIPEASADKGVSADVAERIRLGIGQALPDMVIHRIGNTPVSGLYEVQMGTDVFYVTGDGRYGLRGDLFDLQRQVNLSDMRRSALRAERLRRLSSRDWIEFSQLRTHHTLYVFTDVNCTYCRLMHRDIQELNRLGIGVRYLAYPVIGDPDQALRVMTSIWCADDRQQALTRAKQGGRVEERDCANPVAQQLALGQSFGVRGTPAIYLEDGRELPGYMQPRELLQYLNR